MQIIISLTPDPSDEYAGHDEPLYSKSFELDYLPPVGMNIQIGEIANGDIMSGDVTWQKLDLRSGTTEVEVMVKFTTDEILHELAKLNGFISRDRDITM